MFGVLTEPLTTDVDYGINLLLFFLIIMSQICDNHMLFEIILINFQLLDVMDRRSETKLSEKLHLLGQSSKG